MMFLHPPGDLLSPQTLRAANRDDKSRKAMKRGGEEGAATVRSMPVQQRINRQRITFQTNLWRCCCSAESRAVAFDLTIQLAMHRGPPKTLPSDVFRRSQMSLKRAGQANQACLHSCFYPLNILIRPPPPPILSSLAFYKCCLCFTIPAPVPLSPC